MKKVISLILCLAMLLTAALPLASAEERSGKDVPIVYVQGQGWDILTKDGKHVYPTNLPENYLADAVADCLPYFKDALLSDQWETYRQKLGEWVYPIYEEMILDGNGDPSNGSYMFWDYAKASVTDKKTANGYSIYDYEFGQDWRLDPFENAEKLKGYIDRVKAATGSDKVNLVGRCEGANVILAYLDQYGCDDVRCIELYVSSVQGVEPISAVFSDNMYMDAASLKSFYRDGTFDCGAFTFAIDDPVIADLIGQTIKLTSDVYALDAASLFMDTVVLHKFYKEVLVDMLLHSYGTFPGIWSLVTAKDYKEAVTKVFAGKEEEYAGMIAKLNHYDTRVRQRSDEIIKEAVNSGVKFAIYAKYADEYNIIPLSYYSSYLNDGTTCLGIQPDLYTLNLRYQGSSFGATTAKKGTVLTDKQIKNPKYLSPDKKVDCSTCLLPDTTWVIKNSEHRNFPESIHVLMHQFFLSDGEMTVFSDPNWPQYMIIDKQTNVLRPMDSSDYAQPTPEKPITKQSILDMLKAFFLSLVAFIKQLFSGEKIF